MLLIFKINITDSTKISYVYIIIIITKALTLKLAKSLCACYTASSITASSTI